MHVDVRTVTIFLVATFGGAIGIALAFVLAGGGDALRSALGPAAMLLPALAVLLVRVAMGARVPDAGWRHFALHLLPVALLALPLAIHALAVPAVVLLDGGVPWVPWLQPAADGLIHTPASRGWGALTQGGLAGRLVVNALVGLLIVSVLAFFEEIGWRAWLMPRLVERMSERRAALACAALWAAWHLPFSVSGLHSIDRVPTSRLILIAPLGHLGAGLFLTWLWLRARSVVIVSLAHGALNNWGQYAFKYMDASGHDVALLAAVNTAVLVVGGVALTRLNPEHGAANAGGARAPSGPSSFAP